MVEPGEMVLSDVHVRSKPLAPEGDASSFSSTRFPFRVRSRQSDSEGEDPDSVSDSDVLVIRHSLQTPLKEVGLQVWNGCLLLADFFLAHPRLSQNDVWLELGAGTGLCTIAAALSRDAASPPKEIICTDVGGKVIDLCRRNIKDNVSLITDRRIPTRLRVAEVDFLTYDDVDRRVDVYRADTDAFERGVATLPLLLRASTFFAADVIFDADVTEGFFDLLVRVMTETAEEEDRRRLGRKTLYLALEKRMLFSVFDTAESSSPIYDHFAACLEGLVAARFDNGRFAAERMAVDFPQSFYRSYERNEYLELWRLTFTFE